MKKLTKIFIVFVSIFLFFISESKAQIYAIKADRLIDGKSNILQHNVIILVEQNKIKAMGKDVNIPQNAEIINLENKTVLPGFIDAHTHIMADGVDDYGADLYKNSTPFRAIRAVASVRKALWRGFTALRDVESEGTMYTDVDVKRAIEMNIIPGPRLWVSTRGLSITGRYMPFGYSWELDLPKGVQMISGSEECLKAVREQVANGADWIKIYADWDWYIDKDGGISGLTNFTQEELSLMVKETHRLGRKVAAHAVSRNGIKAALDAGVNSIEHGCGFDDELIARAKAQNVYWCPTLLVFEYYFSEDIPPDRRQSLVIEYKSLNKAYKSGLKVALGTDAGSYPWSVNQAKEFEFLVKKAGFEPMDAIKAGTSVAAELLEQSDKIGHLAPGLLADIIAVPGDPLKDITVLQNVKFVMKNGEIIRYDK